MNDPQPEGHMASYIARRKFLATLLGGAASAWACNGLAQSPKRPLIGFLGGSSKAAGARYYSGFPLGMRELGYLEGRDYGLEDRYADGDASRMPLLAEELVRLKPDVMLVGSSQGVLAAKQATASIPIVDVNMIDPIGFSLIASEARPGTNVTRRSLAAGRHGWEAGGNCARPYARNEQDRCSRRCQPSSEHVAASRGGGRRREVGSEYSAGRYSHR